MEVMFTLRYHPKVVRDDIPVLSSPLKTRIRRAIEDKLVREPEKHGKPLRQSLKNYRKLRIGDYRVIFRIEQRTVYIIAVLHRSVVYKSVTRRVG